MEMNEERIFIPEYKLNRVILYSFRISVWFIIGTIGGVLILNDTPFWMPLLGIGMITIFPMIFYWRSSREPKRIVFGEIIKFDYGEIGYINVDYSDIKQIGKKTIRGNGFVLSITGMKNFGSLKQILKELMNKGKIDTKPLKYDTMFSELLYLNEIIYVFPSLFVLLFTIIIIFRPYYVLPKLFGLMVFLISYFLIYKFCKKRIQNET